MLHQQDIEVENTENPFLPMDIDTSVAPTSSIQTLYCELQPGPLIPTPGLKQLQLAEVLRMLHSVPQNQVFQGKSRNDRATSPPPTTSIDIFKAIVAWGSLLC